MTNYTDPMKEFREQQERMKELMDPMKKIRDQMALISDPLKEHRDQMALISDPLKEHRDQMALISDPLKEHRDQMALISDPLKDFRDQMALISDPLKDFRASIERISKPISFTEIHKTFIEHVSLKSFRDVALEVQQEIEIDSEGVVTLDTKRITTAELKELSDEIFYASSSADINSLEQSINKLTDAVESQKDPTVRKILYAFIYPLLAGIILLALNPVVELHMKSHLNSDKRALEKELKAKVSLVVDDKDLLNSLRYVSADTLNVRNSASVKSGTLGYLHFLSTVFVIEKQKNWTLIRWDDPETDAQITGWVFSRYLKKFSFIIKHERPARVLIDSAQYEQLIALERKHYFVEDLPDDMVAELEKGFQGEDRPHLDHLMD